MYLGHELDESGNVMGKYVRELKFARSVYGNEGYSINIKKAQIGNEKNNFEVLCIRNRKHGL